MANRDELKLAEGGRWSNDANPFVVGGHSSGRVENHPRFGAVLSVNFPGYMPPADALAAIRNADLDPEYLELKRLRERDSKLFPLFRKLGYSECEVSRIMETGSNATTDITTSSSIELVEVQPALLNKEREKRWMNAHAPRSENESLTALTAQCKKLQQECGR